MGDTGVLWGWATVAFEKVELRKSGWRGFSVLEEGGGEVGRRMRA